MTEILDELIKIYQGNVLDCHNAMVNRIFDENLDIRGNKPKAYSTDYYWASKLPRGRQNVGRKTKKGFAFDNGYKQFKKDLGYPPLELFGDLKKDYTNGLHKVNDLEYEVRVSKENINKINKNFKEFFKISQDELKILTNV